MPSNLTLRILYTAIFLFILVSFGLGFYLNDILPARIGNVFRLIGRYWIFLLIFFLFAALLADFFRVLNYFFETFPAWITINYTQVKLLYFMCVLFLSFIISFTGFRNFSNPQIVELNLSIDKDESRLEDLNIVAASDLHVGAIISKERLADWIALINRQNPDIILLAGDIFDQSFSSHDSQDIIDELSKLKSKYGVYAVLGNHEHFVKVIMPVDCLERSGIKLLRDQSVTVDNRFVLIGRDDATNRRRKTIDSLISEMNSSLPIILMDHQPSDLHSSVKNKIDLHISGHTHNGQIFPVNLIVSRIWELAYGYRKIGNSYFYVSSGLGLSYLPIRLGTQSEIVRILLKAENQQHFEAIIQNGTQQRLFAD